MGFTLRGRGVPPPHLPTPLHPFGRALRKSACRRARRNAHGWLPRQRRDGAEQPTRRA